MTHADQHDLSNSSSSLAGPPSEVAKTLATYRPADAAEALNGLDRTLASHVIEAMSAYAAIQVLNEPHLVQPAKLIEQISIDRAATILIGMHPDRRADVFRKLPEAARQSLAARLDTPMRETLMQLLSYPPHSAGAIMTTEFVSVPANWTVEQTLQLIHEGKRVSETTAHFA